MTHSFPDWAHADEAARTKTRLKTLALKECPT